MCVCVVCVGIYVCVCVCLHACVHAVWLYRYMFGVPGSQQCVVCHAVDHIIS